MSARQSVPCRGADPRAGAAADGGCAARGVELKWFGDDEPKAFTSRYDSWKYIDDLPHLPGTLAVLEKTLDMRCR